MELELNLADLHKFNVRNLSPGLKYMWRSIIIQDIGVNISRYIEHVVNPIVLADFAGGKNIIFKGGQIVDGRPTFELFVKEIQKINVIKNCSRIIDQTILKLSMNEEEKTEVKSYVTTWIENELGIWNKQLQRSVSKSIYCAHVKKCKLRPRVYNLTGSQIPEKLQAFLDLGKRTIPQKIMNRHLRARNIKTAIVGCLNTYR